MEYDWYGRVNSPGEILQGDFVFNCPIIIPPTTFDPHQDIEVKLLNVVIMSQSCDLQNRKVEIVLVCPYYSLLEFLKIYPASMDGSRKSRDKVIENLKQGNYPPYHLLQKVEVNGVEDYLVVDFRNVYGIHFEYLKTYLSNVENRIRLLPPYREHLSQAFARYFMRVGLPINISI